jgi:predicted small lipoprotein YifL
MAIPLRRWRPVLLTRLAALTYCIYITYMLLREKPAKDLAACGNKGHLSSPPRLRPRRLHKKTTNLREIQPTSDAPPRSPVQPTRKLPVRLLPTLHERKPPNPRQTLSRAPPHPAIVYAAFIMEPFPAHSIRSVYHGTIS